jgi:hypothetical protein
VQNFAETRRRKPAFIFRAIIGPTARGGECRIRAVGSAQASVVSTGKALAKHKLARFGK